MCNVCPKLRISCENLYPPPRIPTRPPQCPTTGNLCPPLTRGPKSRQVPGTPPLPKRPKFSIQRFVPKILGNIDKFLLKKLQPWHSDQFLADFRCKCFRPGTMCRDRKCNQTPQKVSSVLEGCHWTQGGQPPTKGKGGDHTHPQTYNPRPGGGGGRKLGVVVGQGDGVGNIHPIFPPRLYPEWHPWRVLHWGGFIFWAEKANPLEGFIFVGDFILGRAFGWY